MNINAPALANSRYFIFVYTTGGQFVGEIGYFTPTNLASGAGSKVVSSATTDRWGITAGAANYQFNNGNYIFVGHFDIAGNGFSSSDADKGFRVTAPITGDTTVNIGAANIITSTYQVLSVTNQYTFASKKVYCYSVLPGADFFNSRAARFDGASFYTVLNGAGTSTGGTFAQDLVVGTYDITCIVDMNGNLTDPLYPSLDSGVDYILKLPATSVTSPTPLVLSGFTLYHDPALLEAPQNFWPTANSAYTITLGWNAVSGASSYRLYRSSNYNGPFNYLTSTTNTSYVDSGLPPITYYYYQIYAANASGVLGDPSPVRTANTYYVPAPNTPTASNITATSVTLSWNAISSFGYDIYDAYNSNPIGFTYGTSYPVTGLASDTTYMLRVASRSDNTSNNNQSSGYVTIKTVDIIKPTVVSVTPANNSTLVALNATVIAVFSEPLNTATVDASSFKIENGGLPVAGTYAWSNSNKTVTFTPSASLTYATVYTVVLTTAIADISGNTLASSQNLQFTAAPDNPWVTAVTPVHNTTSVHTTTTIAVTFNEPMNPASIDASSFIVNDGSSNISGTIAYSGNTATFTPSAKLGYKQNYTVQVTTAATDAAGNVLMAPFSATFQTAEIGKYWKKVAATPPWTGRYGFAAISFAGKMFVIGGHDGLSGVTKNDVYSSVDGITWTLETGSAAWAPRTGHTVTELNGKLYLIGGEKFVFFNDVWSSSDGIQWTLETSAAAFSGRTLHGAAAFDYKLWVIGGAGSGYGTLGDAWSSPNGVTWTRTVASGAFQNRSMLAAASFNSKLRIYDGSTGQPSFYPVSQMASSSDGVTWVTAPGFGSRYDVGSAVYQGKIILLGGYDSSYYYSDVRYSSDGVTFTWVSPENGYSGRRAGNSVVVHNNLVWLLGNSRSGTQTDDVWQME